MSIKISKLQNHIEVVPKLANLLYELIYKSLPSSNSVEEIQTWFNEWKNNDIPLAFVALNGNIPIGMCSLQLNDGVRPDLKPWLGDLCVDLSFQNKGVGKSLIEAAKQQAKEQGFEKLYLFSIEPEMAGYYQHLGWMIMGVDNYCVFRTKMIA